MSLADGHIAAIELIHAAGTAPDLWTAALTEIAAGFGCRAGAMTTYHPGQPDWQFSTSFGIAPDWVARYASDFTLNNNPWEAAFRPKPVGTAAAGWMLASIEELHRSRLYNEWARPQGFEGAGLVKTAMDESGSGMLVFICPRGRHMDSEDVARLAALSPHFVRAVKATRMIGALRGRLRLAESLLDDIGTPILVVDRDGSLVHVNEGGKAVLDRADGLSSRHGMVTAARSDETTRLKALVAAAASRSGERGGQIAVSRPSGRRALALLVAPVGPGLETPVAIENRAVIFISDPDAEVPDLGKALRALYGLTPTEADVVNLLASEGLSVEEVADRLAINRSTVRSHLARVFAKTGTSRQAELVRLALLALPGWRSGGR